MMKDEIYDANQQLSAITEALSGIKLIDTHEHIIPEAVHHNLELDFTYLLVNYLRNDMISAGISGDEMAMISTPSLKISEYIQREIHRYRRSPAYPFTERLPLNEMSLDEKWQRFAPYWNKTRNTGHARCILLAIKNLFNINDLNDRTYRALSKAIQESRREGWYRYVMKERAGIELSVNDIGTTDVDQDFFRSSIRFDRFADINNHNDLNRLEYDTDIAIQSLSDLVQALEADMSKKLENGLIAVKIGLAYQRKIHFDEATRHEAEQVFNRLFRHSRTRLSWEESKPLQDYMIHQIIRLATESGLPIQIHTGMHGGGNNVISNSDPTLLTNLFIRYPKAKFDIFHAGYPFHSKVAVLAKNYRNVYADMCWVYIISPYMAARILHEWIDTIPICKILGFGGDHLIVEGAYGHSVIARRTIACVLAEKVEAKQFSENEAITYGRMILRENAKELFEI